MQGNLFALLFLLLCGCGYVWYLADRPYSSEEVKTALDRISHKSCPEILVDMGAKNDRKLCKLIGATHSTLQRIRRGESLPTIEMNDAIRGLAFLWEIHGHNWLILYVKYNRYPLDLWSVSLNPTFEIPLPDHFDNA